MNHASVKGRTFFPHVVIMHLNKTPSFIRTPHHLLCCLSAVFLLTACPQKIPDLPVAVPRTVAPETVFVKYIQQSGRSVSDPTAWVKSIFSAIDELKLPRSNENACAVMAVIEQESGFKEDPVVPGLAALLNKKINKMEENLVMFAALEVRLNQPMTTGSPMTFREGIKQIKTERDLAQWYEAFTEAKFTGIILDRFGKGVDELISTVGSMQVSVNYARKLAQAIGKSTSDMRDTLYTRDGGVFYGTAHLLYYPARYDNIIYRFADYNAGHYASRNAGFQLMLNQLTGGKITPDGDLLSHGSNDSEGIAKPSQTQLAITKLFAKSAKNIKNQTIVDDLSREKSIEFEQSTTYATVLQLMDDKGLKPIPASIPKITLTSEKITRKLTTEWYSNGVNGRYQKCLSFVSPLL